MKPREIRMAVMSGQKKMNYSQSVRSIQKFYALRGFAKPFMVTCTHPTEMQFIANMMIKLHKEGDERFMNLYSQCESLSGSEHVDLLEQAAAALKRYVMEKLIEVKDKLINDDPSVDDLFLTHPAFYVAGNLMFDVVIEKYKDKELENQIFYGIAFEKVMVVCEYPDIVFNNAGRLHNVWGPAIIFKSEGLVEDIKIYAINGREMPSYLYEKPFTFEEFLKCQDEEIRAAMWEIVVGRNEVESFFPLEEVDRTTVKHEVAMYDGAGQFVGTKEQEEELVLYHTTHCIKGTVDPVSNRRDGKIAFIKFVCPSTGTQYLIYTSPSYTTAIEAAKAARPFDMGDEYKWNQRA